MRLIILGLIVIAATAQTTDQRIFHFAHTQSAPSAQEIGIVLKNILDMPVKLSEDKPPSELTVNGTPDQLNAAAWILNELDQSTPVAGMRQYALSGTTETAIRVYHPNNPATLQQFMEMSTVIRTVPEVRRLFTHTSSETIVMRGTPDQAALCEWLLSVLDTPANQNIKHSVSVQNVMPDPRNEGTTQVFYVAGAATLKEFTELATAIRTVTQTRRVYTFSEGREIVIRGFPSQLTMANWLFDQLDQPVSSGSKTEYQVPGEDDVVRIFELSQRANASENAQNLITQIRNSTKAQFAFSYGSRGLLVLRGTAAQIAAAEPLAQQLIQP
jgi:hypothetical protein